MNNWEVGKLYRIKLDGGVEFITKCVLEYTTPRGEYSVFQILIITENSFMEHWKIGERMSLRREMTDIKVTKI